MEEQGSSWAPLVIAALTGAVCMAMSAVWIHRKIVDRVLEQRLKKVNEGTESVERIKRCKLKRFPNRRGHSVPAQKDVRQASPVEIWWADKGTQMENPEEPNKKTENTSESSSKEAYVHDGEKSHTEGLKGGKMAPENGRILSDDDGNKFQPLKGLPKVRTRLEGPSFNHNRRTPYLGATLLRQTPPKSPAKSGLFDMDVSDEDVDILGMDKDLFNELYVLEGLPATENPEDPFPRMDEDENSCVLQQSSSSIDCLGMPIDQNEKSDSLSTRPHSIADELLGAPDPVAADILRKEPQQETFVRMKVTPNDPPTAEEEEVCFMLQQCLALREKYLFIQKEPPWRKASRKSKDPDPFHYEPEPKSQHVFRIQDGVVRVYANNEAKEELFPVPDATTFFTDMHRILRITGLGNVRTFCYHRLHLLEQKFSLHLMLNADREFLAQKSAPHRDFYNVRKVDTHVHHSSCMNQKHLLRFIKSKLRNEPDEVVIFRDGQYLTLKEVFESLDLTGYDLNVDLLDVHADKNTFHRFDKFNLKYNPCGQSRLREIFLKQDNLIQGRFLAELTKEVFQDLAVSKYQMGEYRISVYGRKQSEWDQLASWIVNNELYSENVVWLIQVPRLYIFYKKMGIVTSFQTILDNLFLPLFEVTVDPASHPQLHIFLKQVVGFDMVDDESKPERRPNKHMQTPAQWDINFNPAYSYWAYYIYANMYTLNKLRESKGLCTIKFRPHSGEAGDLDHLASTFLLAHSINHGNNLRKSPGLQYLYYLAQIGLAMSPLSNNSLFLDYHRNPFPMFFSRGLNVSLSTDDPLQIHLTKEPLVEEYSIAAQVWKLSSCDLCEIARNSVYQSGFPHSMKLHWVGHKYFKRGAAGNDIHKTNVPHMRVEFRYETWQEELQYICLGAARIPEDIDP